MEKEKEKVESKSSVKENLDFWTAEERTNSKTKYGCDILISNGSSQDVSTRDAPTDAYIIKYVREDMVRYDLTRGTKISVFDMYWDKFKGDLKEINYGNGTIKPNLWGYQAPATKKKKRKV